MGLTKYQEGSLRELWSIAFPLMLSSLSVMSMLFVDRLLLAHYSTQALNAAVNATTLGWSFLVGWMTMASIAEVFVAQYNGAGQKNRLGEPVWQMIWLSLASVICFIPLSLWAGSWFYGDSPDKAYEREYLSWMMYFGPSCPLYGALCAFFVGLGKPKIITILAVVTNLINALLDYVLIFGIEGILDPMGVKGAAIATCGSSIFQVLILFYFFLSKHNKSNYGTGQYGLRPAALWQCIKIGFPTAVFVVLEIFAWAMFYAMMTEVSERHITIAGIGQSLVLLFFFFAEGISKAVATLAGNFIGSNRKELIQQVVISGVKLHVAFFLIILVISITALDFLMGQFLPKASPEMIESIREALLICLVGNAIYLFFEGLRMVFSGVLTAAGDTLFLLIAGASSVWMLLVLPVYLIVVQHAASIEVAVLICVIYSVIASLLYFYRLNQGKWKELSLIQQEANQDVELKA